MSRTSKTVVTDVTIEEAQNAANIYAKKSREMETKKASMNAIITRIRTKYEPVISEIESEMEEQAKVLESFGIANKSSWGERKSLELKNCTIGFRLNPHSVEKPKKFTWPAIVAFFKANKKLKEFIRTKEEVNKEELLKKKDDAKFLKLLETAGNLTIEQKESFFIDTKAEG